MLEFHCRCRAADDFLRDPTFTVCNIVVALAPAFVPLAHRKSSCRNAVICNHFPTPLVHCSATKCPVLITFLSVFNSEFFVTFCNTFVYKNLYMHLDGTVVFISQILFSRE